MTRQSPPARFSRAEVWRLALQRARKLDPDRIAARIVLGADTGLRAARYDVDGGRTSFVTCDDPENCDEGPEDHSHLATSDPTGNRAVSSQHTDTDLHDLRDLDRAHDAFVKGASVVLDFVCGKVPDPRWHDVVRLDATLMPGTVQAGVDVDHDYLLPPAITQVDNAVAKVAAIASRHLPRDPTQDERNWTAGLADEDCCAWHLEVPPIGRYRRPRAGGTNCCAECLQVAEWIKQKPPMWFMEALIERDAKPKAYDRALSKLADELDVPPHRRAG